MDRRVHARLCCRRVPCIPLNHNFRVNLYAPHAHACPISECPFVTIPTAPTMRNAKMLTALPNAELDLVAVAICPGGAASRALGRGHVAVLAAIAVLRPHLGGSSDVRVCRLAQEADVFAQEGPNCRETGRVYCDAGFASVPQHVGRSVEIRKVVVLGENCGDNLKRLMLVTVVCVNITLQEDLPRKSPC